MMMLLSYAFFSSVSAGRISKVSAAIRNGTTSRRPISADGVGTIQPIQPKSSAPSTNKK
jgi:hypothetical protein